MLLSCFDIASCKPRSAEHQRHCLSTPLRSYGGAPRVAPEILLVCGNLGLIEEAADNGKVRELAAAAQRAADLGAKLTAQLLAFSRRQRLSPKLVSTYELISEFEGLIRQAVGGACEVRLLTDGPLWLCHVDPTPLMAAATDDAMFAGRLPP
jgi:signal transduction histidine kinase